MAVSARGVLLDAQARDETLDQALERIAELSRRLWAAQAAHHPQPARPGRPRPWSTQRHLRCVGCRQSYPCPTVQALDPQQRYAG